MPMLMTGERGATEILKQQQHRIKDLFQKFDDAVSDRQKKSIGDAAVREIEAHTQMVEEIFYPAVRRLGERKRVVQAQAAHEVAKLLIKELKGLSAGEHYNSRFGVLQSSVTQQVEEEEAELIPRVEGSDLDLARLGKEMIVLKARIRKNGLKAFARKTGIVTLGLAVVGAVAWFVNRDKSFKTAERY